jgi:hypothetical protein
MGRLQVASIFKDMTLPTSPSATLIFNSIEWGAFPHQIAPTGRGAARDAPELNLGENGSVIPRPKSDSPILGDDS